MKVTLLLAGTYNILWGVWVIFWPYAMFDLAGLVRPNYPQIWQCVGMIVGCYGIGYIIASADPIKWWPIVLVGFIGKVLGPIGFVYSVVTGDFPWAFGIVNLFNDLIWWVPFAVILWLAARGPGDTEPPESLERVLGRAVDQHGQSLLSITMNGPTLVVCLRHLGCTFCREALADLARQRKAIEDRGVSLVLVHMSTDAEIKPYLSSQGMSGAHRISDPQRRIYRTLGLERGGFWQLFGPIVWWRGLLALLKGRGIGQLAGDGFQMPGAFLLYRGKLVNAIRHKTAADRPDYVDISACPL